jgi:hypothetical protein
MAPNLRVIDWLAHSSCITGQSSRSNTCSSQEHLCGITSLYQFWNYWNVHIVSPPENYPVSLWCMLIHVCDIQNGFLFTRDMFSKYWNFSHASWTPLQQSLVFTVCAWAILWSSITAEPFKLATWHGGSLVHWPSWISFNTILKKEKLWSSITARQF